MAQLTQRLFGFALMLTAAVGAASAPLATDHAYVDAAKPTSVHTLDAALPGVPLEDWLGTLAPGAAVSWEVNDCGEQTGTTADAGRDLPVCAEARLPLPGEAVVHIQVGVGSVLRGVSDERGLYGIFVQRGREIHSFQTLSELARSIAPAHRPTRGVPPLPTGKPQSG